MSVAIRSTTIFVAVFVLALGAPAGADTIHGGKPYEYLQEPHDSVFAASVPSFDYLANGAVTSYFADSFSLDREVGVLGVSWWGSSIDPTLDFNLRFFEEHADGGPDSDNVFAAYEDVTVTGVEETEMDTPGVYRWQYYFDSPLRFTPGQTYFFSAAENAMEQSSLFLWQESEGTPHQTSEPAWNYFEVFPPGQDDPVVAQWQQAGAPNHMSFGLIVPEPGTMVLLGAGLAGIGVRQWRKKGRNTR